MKQIGFLKTIAVMIGMLMSVSLVSCGDDDDEPDTSDYVQVYYRMEMGQGWYDLFDIDLTFNDVNGQEYTGTAYRNSDYNDKVKLSLAPSKFVFKVVAKPRSEAPAIVAGEKYDFSTNCLMNIYKYADGTANNVPVYTLSGTTSLSSDDVEDMNAFVSEEHIIINGEYTFN